jgi:hypothetical protein
MYCPKCDCIVTETTVTGSKKCLRCLHEWWVPSASRIAEYESEFKKLTEGGGYMMDFIGLEKMYKDVVEHKKSVAGSKN